MEANTISKPGAIFEIPEINEPEEAALDRIKELRKQTRYFVAEPRRWMGSVRRVLSARAIQGSNSIEGFNVSVEDALAAVEGDEPAEAETRDWQAVSGYRRAMTYVLQLAKDEHFRYTPELIRGLHFMMTEYDLQAGSGLWRPGPIWIRNDATGEVVYEGPDSEDVPDLISALVDQLDEQGGPAIVRGAMAHLNLAMIHPFRDGNGRMARGLQTLVLAREAILAPELSSIEEYLGRNTQAYYQVLATVGRGAWHPERDSRPWVRFCLEAHYVQAASVLRRVLESERMWREVEEIRTREHLQERVLLSLLDTTMGLRIRNSSYRRNALAWEDEAISAQVATNDLRGLVEAGLLVRRGTKRGTYYIAGKPLIQVREKIRAEREPIDPSELFST